MRYFQLALLTAFVVFSCKYVADDQENRQSPSDQQKNPDQSLVEPVLPKNFPFFTVKTGTEGAAKVYRAILTREPTGDETAAVVKTVFVKQAAAWWTVIDALAKSQEFKDKVRPAFTNEEMLTNLYQGFLGRDPDSKAIETYLPQIAGGYLSHTARAIGSSYDFVSKHFVYPAISRRTIEKAIDRTYQALLWRGSDPGGLQGYADSVSNDGMKGWRSSLKTISESDEFKANVKPNKSNTEILNRMFERLLGRSIDQESLAFLLPKMDKGEVAIAAEIVGTSDEYFEKLLASQDDRPAPPEGFKVAFTGDQGHFDSTRQVYRLIKQENPGLLVIAGDFDYESNPAEWEKMMNEELGATFPILGIVGNHDTSQWSKTIGYRNVFTTRQQHMPGIQCSGDYGVNSVCTYKNLFFAMSGIGTLGSGHEAYLKAELPKTNHMWKVCAWHKLQEKMQVGGKHDETGWVVYETCRENGAIVATAHEHSYSRTHLMSNFEKQVVDSTSSTLQLAPGRSFAFVSGLGGHTVRSKKFDFPWMASSSTSTSGGTHGVLFCSFNIEGEADKAGCYFKNIRGEIVDQFTVIAPPKIDRGLASADAN